MTAPRSSPDAHDKSGSSVASLNAGMTLKSDGDVQKKGDNLVRLLQSELKRVGCEPGKPSDIWSKSSEAALAAFNKVARTNYPTKIASTDALDGIRLKADRVCPLECVRSEHLEGDRCVKTVCSSEQVPNSNGSCDKKPEVRHSSKKQIARSDLPETRRKTAVTTRTETPARVKSGRGCFQFNGGTYCE